jgi:hypothetical protein
MARVGPQRHMKKNDCYYYDVAVVLYFQKFSRSYRSYSVKVLFYNIPQKIC